ncbi:hypothetical protein [Streptomyces sp. NPDC050982]|uniref:hypothetical protein n=1 Tax=Streptomyces sp. NPDC050982 TaxID=3154746 RepID=UPI0033D2E37F
MEMKNSTGTVNSTTLSVVVGAVLVTVAVTAHRRGRRPDAQDILAAQAADVR